MKNDAFAKAHDDYYVQSKRFMLPMVQRAGRVLDVGCGSGAFGKLLLQEGLADELYGVEIFEDAAQFARSHYKQVHVGDVEALELSYEGCFDAIVFADILEHLKNPEELLIRSRAWLASGGRIVCCVPNVRYWRVAWNLVIGGDWRYEAQGIMDHTHLRFFTSKSFRRMLKSAGFEVEAFGVRIAEGRRQERFNRCTGGCFEELLAYQLMFRARPTSVPFRN